MSAELESYGFTGEEQSSNDTVPKSMVDQMLNNIRQEHEAELANMESQTRAQLLSENAIAIIVLKNLLGDIRAWASTAQNARNAMMGNIISVPLSDEMIAISKAQERTLRGIEEELVDRLKSAKIKLE